MATDLIADLTRVVADQPDITMTDAVCERMGALLADDAGASPDERVDPHSLAEATLSAAEASVVAALTATTKQADAWRGPWRVLTGLASVLPHPHPTPPMSRSVGCAPCPPDVCCRPRRRSLS